ncbi:thioesterase superfamily protein [mine drainage metagenome]|uniref:Thioesterase superfamily protein n=1 Tax=mine drainage metagenome TaxID=410659 RepID=T0ZNL5_9ZZZZ
MEGNFVFEDTVRIYDTDAQGVVHYAGYYRFFTDAAENFMRETIGTSYPLLDDDTWFVVVESKAQYRKSAKLGDALSVVLKPEKVSEKALKFVFRILRDGEPICDGYITQVSINRKEWKAVNLPASLLEKIGRLE